MVICCIWNLIKIPSRPEPTLITVARGILHVSLVTVWPTNAATFNGQYIANLFNHFRMEVVFSMQWNFLSAFCFLLWRKDCPAVTNCCSSAQMSLICLQTSYSRITKKIILVNPRLKNFKYSIISNGFTASLGFVS